MTGKKRYKSLNKLVTNSNHSKSSKESKLIKDEDTGELYLVEWNIPSTPAKDNVRFYYHLKKLREKYGLESSTKSIIKTSYFEAAEAVYNLAKKYGEAHIYRVEEISPNRTGSEENRNLQKIRKV